jgi:hypothetical protein
MVLDTRQGRPSEAIAAAAGVVPLLIVTHHLLADLAAELGDPDVAALFLHRLVERTGRPIGLNLPTATGSQTTFWAPASWSRERLAGFVAVHHAALERQFGVATLRE